MENGKNFVNNFRDVFNPNLPNSMAPLAEEKGSSSAFQNATRGQTPDDDGYQQNLIGLGALAVLSSIVGGFTPSSLAYLGDLATSIGLSATMRTKELIDNKNKNNIVDTSNGLDADRFVQKVKELQKVTPMLQVPTPDELRRGKRPQLPDLQKQNELIKPKRRML